VAARALAPGEVQALHDFWLAQETPQQAHALADVLARLHREERWIACGCTNAPKNPPLLGVTKRIDGSSQASYYVRRLTDRAAHQASCVFFFEQTNRDSGRAQHGLSLEERPDFVALAGAGARVKHAEAPPKLRTGRSGKTEREDSMARRLFWLLDRAGVNRWPAEHGNGRAALLRLAEHEELGHGIPMRRLVYFHPAAWQQRWLHGAFELCRRMLWAPSAYWVAEITAADVAGGQVQLAGESNWLKVDGHLTAYGDARSGVRFPMLMCAQVVPADNDSGMAISRAYAHPIHSSEYWIPVDSNLERGALGDLCDVARWLNDAKQVDVLIGKPLANWRGTDARPDFTVELTGRPDAVLLVETFGFDDADYLERKQRTLQRLAGYPVVIDDRASPSLDASRTLKSAVAKWALNAARRPAGD
jgi:hypothetical protein